MFHYFTNPTDLRKEVGLPNAVRLVIVTGESGSGTTHISEQLSSSMDATVYDLGTLGKWEDAPDTKLGTRRRFLIRPHWLGEQIIGEMLAKRSVVVCGSCDNMAALYWVVRKIAKSKQVSWIYVNPDPDVWYAKCDNKGKGRTSKKRWYERRILRYKLAMTLAINCLGKDEAWLEGLITDSSTPGFLGTGIIDRISWTDVSLVELEKGVSQIFSQAGLFAHTFGVSMKNGKVSFNLKPQSYGKA